MNNPHNDNMKSIEDMVREFHVKFEHPINVGFRQDILVFYYNLIKEEVSEFEDAIKLNDKEDMLDALADILYVTTGVCIAIGVSPDILIRTIQKSNMSKTPYPGHHGTTYVMRKPINWKSPNFKDIVKEIEGK